MHIGEFGDGVVRYDFSPTSFLIWSKGIEMGYYQNLKWTIWYKKLKENDDTGENGVLVEITEYINVWNKIIIVEKLNLVGEMPFYYDMIVN